MPTIASNPQIRIQIHITFALRTQAINHGASKILAPVYRNARNYQAIVHTLVIST